MAGIKELFDRLCAAPFPVLGKRVGDFGFYDSMLAGYAQRASRGEKFVQSEIPDCDDESVDFASELRQKSARSDEENAFLQYFDLLEEIRSTLHTQCCRTN